MPAPISPSADARSNTTTSKPFRARPSAVVRPPIPAPAMRTGDAALMNLSLNHALVRHAAAIHLVFQADHRRTAEMPGQPVPGGTARDDLAAQERKQVIYSV